MDAAHWLRPESSRARRQHRHCLGCEGQHNLLQKLSGVQAYSWHLVVSRKAAYVVSKAAGNVPDAGYLLGAKLLLPLQVGHAL